VRDEELLVRCVLYFSLVSVTDVAVVVPTRKEKKSFFFSLDIFQAAFMLFRCWGIFLCMCSSYASNIYFPFARSFL
jgi:hypothetical protein